MDNEKLIKKLEELAEETKYGEVTIEYTFSRGKIVKAVIKNTKEVVLLS